jgi:enamine deaminase RidA (YjgF/YER057c/UK114 family)
MYLNTQVALVEMEVMDRVVRQVHQVPQDYQAQLEEVGEELLTLDGVIQLALEVHHLCMKV